MLKNIISILLTLLILLSAFSALPFSAAAEEARSPAPENTAVTELPTQSEEPTEAPTEAGEAGYPVITEIRNLADGAQLSWNSYEGAATYRVYYRRAAVYTGSWEEKYASSGWTRLATVSGNSYVHTGLSDAEVGVYTVRAVGEKGDFISSYNLRGWENTYYAAPAITSLTSDDDGVTLMWNASWKKHGDGSGERYRIYRRVGGGSWVRLASGVTEGPYTDLTAQPGNIYTYTVRMTDSTDSVFLSDFKSSGSVATYLPLTALENTAGGVKLSWSRFTGASKYRIYYRAGGVWTRLAQVSGTSYTDTAIKDGQTRVYTVRALSGESFVSGYKRAGWETTYHSAPVIRSLSNTADGVTLTWQRAIGAEDYRIYRKTGGGAWVRLAQTAASSYTDTTAVSGTTYTYTLRMVSASGDRFMSDFNGGKKIAYVAAPVIKNVENLVSGAKLTWDKVNGAAGYRVYYRTAGGWTRLASTNRTEYTDLSVRNGETREYTLRCVDAKDAFVSDFHRDGAVNTFFAPPEIRSLTASDSGIGITWDRVAGAEDYCVYRRTEGGSWTRLIKTSDTDYTDTSAMVGIKYEYTLRLISADGKRFMSSYLGGKSIVSSVIPAFTSLTNGADGVILSWNNGLGGHYRIYYKSGAGWTRLATVDSSPYTDTAVADGETRVYTIRCVDDSGNFLSDFDREGKSQTYYAPPAVTSVSWYGGSYTIGWKKAQGDVSYRVYRRSADGEGWTRIGDGVVSDLFIDTGAKAGGIYSYTVRVLDAGGKLVSAFTPTPYYCDGTVADGVITQDGAAYRFEDGQPAAGYYTEDGALTYYRAGRRIANDWFITQKHQALYTRARWLCALMRASGAEPDVSEDDAEAVFALAESRGILSAYTEEDLYAAVTRRFAADTMVRALGYPTRAVDHVADVPAGDSLMTLAYYGYFIPDDADMLRPDAAVTPEEFDRLMSELELYRLLKGKTVLSFGDSIMYGAGNEGEGIADMLGEKYGMHAFDYSVPGAVTGVSSGKNHIPDQIRKAVSNGREADVILIDGGTNDTFRTDLGTFTEGYDMSAASEESFTGGLEKAMWLISQTWKDTPVIYIRPHDMALVAQSVEQRYGERGLEVAEKWHAAAVDLFGTSALKTEDPYLRERYTMFDEVKGYRDSIHPTALGYAEFYLPEAAKALAPAFD